MVFCAHRGGGWRERDEMWFAVLHRLLPFRNGSWCTPRRKEGRRMNGGETAPGSCFTSKRKGGIEGAVFVFLFRADTLPRSKKAKLEMSLPKCISFSVSLKAQNLIWLKASAGEEKNIFAFRKEGPCLPSPRPWHHSFLLGEGNQNSGK